MGLQFKLKYESKILYFEINCVDVIFPVFVFNFVIRQTFSIFVLIFIGVVFSLHYQKILIEITIVSVLSFRVTTMGVVEVTEVKTKIGIIHQNRYRKIFGNWKNFFLFNKKNAALKIANPHFAFCGKRILRTNKI